MKKILAIFSVLAAVFVFASCDHILKEVSPKDTWIKEPIDYKVESETVSLMYYLYYSDSGTTTNQARIDPGLTIVVNASSDEAAVKLFGTGATVKTYIIKNFPKDSKQTAGGITVEINDTLWGAIGLARNFSRKQTGTPECLTTDEYTELGSFADWGKILAQIVK